MMKQLLFYTILFLYSFNIYAQIDECGDKWIISGDTIDLKDSVFCEKALMLCFYSFDAYINSYIDIPDGTRCFFDFVKEMNFINKKEFFLFKDREQCFTIQQNDSAFTLLYGDSLLYVTLPNPASCYHSIEGEYKRKLVKFFDENGCLYYSNFLYKKFDKMRKAIRNRLVKQGYSVESYISGETGTRWPVVVLYQYDNEKGLILYKTCAKYHSLLKNEFYTRYIKQAKKFCTEHHCSRIIFADYLFYDNISNGSL